MRRVLHVVESWPPLASGYARRSASLIDAQRHHEGLDPSVLVSSRQFVYGAEEAPGADHLVHPSRREALLRKVRPFTVDSAALRRAIREHIGPADVAHVHWSSTIGAAVAAEAAATGTPWVAEVRFDLAGAAAAQSGHIASLAEPLARRHFERHLSTADAVTTASQETADLLVNEGLVSEPPTVIPNAADRRFFDASAEDGALRRRELGIGDDEIVVGSTAKQLRYEGLDLLVMAASRSVSRIHLVFVGDGPEAEDLAEMARRRRVPATFTGPRPFSEMPSWLASFDLFAVPRRESSVTRSAEPLKLAEALAAGCACLGSAVGGTARLLAGGRGRLIAPDSVVELTQALDDLGADPQTRAALGLAARDWALRQPSWDDGADALAGLYDRVAAGATRGGATVD